MKKLFMVAMAAVFSVAMVSTGYAQGTGTTEKKDEKKADAPADKKMDKAEKKAPAKKKAANPCAAKDAKDAKADAPKADAKK
jgi:hypothetical protein